MNIDLAEKNFMEMPTYLKNIKAVSEKLSRLDIKGKGIWKNAQLSELYDVFQINECGRLIDVVGLILSLRILIIKEPSNFQQTVFV